MAFNRISTYAVHQTTLREATRVQTDLFNLQNQISSGRKNATYADMDGQVEQFVQLETQITRVTQYTESNKAAISQLNTTDNALGQIIDSGTELKTLIMQRRSGLADGVGFEKQLEGFWKAISAQLNSNYGGRFLFSGTRSDAPAVNDDTFPTTEVPGVPDTTYYEGSGQDLLTRINDGYETSLNVRADDPAFQKIFAALAAAKQGDANDDDIMLAKAYDLLQEGVDGVIRVQANVNANKVLVEEANGRLDSLRLYWTGVKEDINNTDLISASTQVAINQGILQASFQVFARINQLKLSDYL